MAKIKGAGWDGLLDGLYVDVAHSILKAEHPGTAIEDGADARAHEEAMLFDELGLRKTFSDKETIASQFLRR